MAGLSKETFKFMKQLARNNNRQWFTEHKATYENSQEEFKYFALAIENALQKHDEIEAHKVYRIYRDVRFSKDKTPYKDGRSIYFKRATKWKRGGYYLWFQPGGNSFIGGGFWNPNKDDLLRIRQEIDADPKLFNKVFKSASFKKFFGSLGGQQLKTAPRGFNPDHEAIEFLRYKSFVCTHPLSDAFFSDPKASEKIAGLYKKYRPFFDLFSDILTTNINGEPLD